MHEQHRQQRSAPRATERQRAVFFDHLNRPEDSEFDHQLLPHGQRYHRTGNPQTAVLMGAFTSG